MTNKQAIMAASLVVSVLIAVGCGGGADEPTGDAPSETPTLQLEVLPPQQTPTLDPAATQISLPTAFEERQAEATAQTETETPAPQPAGSCTDDSEFVADVTVPDGTAFAPGESFTKTWQLSNSGTCTWTTGYRLYFFGGNQMGAPTAGGVTRNVSPGQTLDISLDMIAPDSPGEHTGHWKLISTGGSFFGITSYVQIIVTGAGPDATLTGTVTAVDSGSCVDDSAFVADVTVPDGTQFAPGESFTKTWRLENTGTCTWDSGYVLTFKTGDQMGPSDAAGVTQSVAPGETLEISVDMVAPDTPGDYSGSWRLDNAEGVSFGSSPYVTIVVQ